MGKKNNPTSSRRLSAPATPEAETTARGKLLRLASAWAEGIKPRTRIPLDTWADLHRFLPSETSSEPGRWRTSRFPFLKRIMRCLSPDSIAREVVAMKGAQLGFTEVCINWILYGADQNPGPMMYVQRTEDAATDFATQKLEPNIRECHQVATLLGPDKPKHLANETTNKGFPGGFIVLGGSNSGAFLRSKSIRDAMVDEEDSFKGSIDGEGSPVAMVKKRQVNFPWGKRFRLSTPKFKETSTIEPAFEDGTQERYYLPCPHCNPEHLTGGTWFWLKWEMIKYGEELDGSGNPVDVWADCPACGARIDEHEKTAMLTAGRWLTEKGSPGSPVEADEDATVVSFHISSLYSPLGFFSWRDAVAEFFEYRRKRDKALLQVFINQTLGETYSAAGQDISAGWLYARREEYDVGINGSNIPSGVLSIVAGADIQEDRIEMEVVGFGIGGETWSLGYHVLYGATDRIGDLHGLDSNGQPTAWTLLHEALQTTYIHECGTRFRVECTLIDTGFRAEVVHVFCRTHEGQRVFPVRGRSGWGKGFVERPKRRTEKYHTWDFVAWVDEIKDQVYADLQNDAPGPGYCHFPIADQYSEKHFSGLTAESKKTKRVGGKTVLYWDCRAGVRNEPLDCRGYAFAAFRVFNPNLEHRANIMAEMSGSVRAVGAEGYQEPRPMKPQQKTRRRGSPGL